MKPLNKWEAHRRIHTYVDMGVEEIFSFDSSATEFHIKCAYGTIGA